jgi:hypothetical protein
MCPGFLAALRREVLKRDHFAHPLQLRSGRKAAPYLARRHVFVDGRSRSQLRTFADGDVQETVRGPNTTKSSIVTLPLSPD